MFLGIKRNFQDKYLSKYTPQIALKHLQKRQHFITFVKTSFICHLNSTWTSVKTSTEKPP